MRPTRVIRYQLERKEYLLEIQERRRRHRLKTRMFMKLYGASDKKAQILFALVDGGTPRLNKNWDFLKYFGSPDELIGQQVQFETRREVEKPPWWIS